MTGTISCSAAEVSPRTHQPRSEFSICPAAPCSPFSITVTLLLDEIRTLVVQTREKRFTDREKKKISLLFQAPAFPAFQH